MTRFIRRILYVIAAVIILGAGWLGYQNRDDGWRGSTQPAWHAELEPISHDPITATSGPIGDLAVKSTVPMADIKPEESLPCNATIDADGNVTGLDGHCPEPYVRRMMAGYFATREDVARMKADIEVLMCRTGGVCRFKPKPKP